MRFTIPCKTFNRLAIIPQNFTEDVPEETRSILKCIRLENHKGNTIAITANQKVAAIELIGKTNEPDGHVHLLVNDEILKAASNEHDVFEVFSAPAIGIGSLKSMFGYQHSGNACIYPKETVMDKWREWAPKKPVTKSKGAIFLNLNYIELLNKSSPSGRLEFPCYVDVDQPVVLRDINNPSWVGLFTPRPPPLHPADVKGATLPNWWN